jgi:hypothetical protein
MQAEILEKFETRRSELEARIKPLRTIWAFYGSNKERIDAIMQHGFDKGLSNAAIVLWFA